LGYHGKAYYTMKSSYDYGLSKIYELVINANPSYAFLLDTNSLLHNKFVVKNCLQTNSADRKTPPRGGDVVGGLRALCTALVPAHLHATAGRSCK